MIFLQLSSFLSVKYYLLCGVPSMFCEQKTAAPHDFTSSRHSSLCLVYSVIPSSTTRLSSIDSASFDDIHYPVSHQIQLVNIVCRFHLDNLYHKNNYIKSIPHK